MRDFNDIGQYGDYVHTLSGLYSTGMYYSGIVGSIQPTIQFMYDNFLTNPIVIGLILTLLVLSLFTFSNE